MGARVAVGPERGAATRWLERRALPASPADVEAVGEHLDRQRRGLLWGGVAAALLAIVLWFVEPITDAFLPALPVVPLVALVFTLSGFRRLRGIGADGGRHPMPSPPALLTWTRRVLPLAAVGLGGLSLVMYMMMAPPLRAGDDPLSDLGAIVVLVFTFFSFVATAAIAGVGEFAIRWGMRRPPMTEGASTEVDAAVASSALAIAEAQMITLAAMFLAPVAASLSFWMDSESRSVVGWTLAVAVVAPALATWVLAHRGRVPERAQPASSTWARRGSS